MIDWLTHWVVLTPNCDDLEGAGTCLARGSFGMPRWGLILGFLVVCLVAAAWVHDMNHVLNERRVMRQRDYLGLCVYCGKSRHTGRACV